MNIILSKISNEWPSVDLAVGREVVGVDVRKVDHALVLRLSPPDCELVIPAPWTFTSCLLAISSADDALSGSALVGLHGATLTGVEQDSSHLDLQFGSITVSPAGNFTASILSE